MGRSLTLQNQINVDIRNTKTHCRDMDRNTIIQETEAFLRRETNYSPRRKKFDQPRKKRIDTPRGEPYVFPEHAQKHIARYYEENEFNGD